MNVTSKEDLNKEYEKIANKINNLTRFGLVLDSIGICLDEYEIGEKVIQNVWSEDPSEKEFDQVVKIEGFCVIEHSNVGVEVSGLYSPCDINDIKKIKI